jgi:trigger factor
VQDVSEFDTVDELRADIATRITAVKKVEAALTVRDRVVDALVELVPDEVPDSLVGHEMQHILERFLERLQRQGIGLQQYVEITGEDEQTVIGRMREQAVRSVKADLALRAIAEQEGLETSEEEVSAEIATLAEETKKKPAEVRRSLEKTGAVEMLRSDMVKRAALEFAVHHAEIRAEDGAVLDLDELLSLQETEETDETDDAAEEAPHE